MPSPGSIPEREASLTPRRLARIAEFFADILLTPAEAVRIRLVSDRKYASNMLTGFQRMAAEGGLKELYAGFVPILAKQIPCKGCLALAFPASDVHRIGLTVGIYSLRCCRPVPGERARARAGVQAHLAGAEGEAVRHGAVGHHARLRYHRCPSRIFSASQRGFTKNETG